MTRPCRRSWRPVVVVCCACVLAVLGVVVLRFTGLPSILRPDERLCGDRYSSDELHRIMNSTAVKDELKWFPTCKIRFSEESPFSFLDIDESTRGEILLHGQPAPLTEDEILSKDGVRGKVERLELDGFDGTVLLWTDDHTYGASSIIWFKPDGDVLGLSFNTINAQDGDTQARNMAIDLFKYISEETLAHPYH